MSKIFVEYKKTTIHNRQRILYKKADSRKLYIKHNGNMFLYSIYKKRVLTRKIKGGNHNEPISFLENMVNYSRQSSISKIFFYNFSKFLNLSLDFDSYINISNDYLDILNLNREPLDIYKNHQNQYDEEFNPEFETMFNNYNNHPKYKGVHSWRFKIVLPQHNDIDNVAKKCFELTSKQLATQFTKLIKYLQGSKQFKSINKFDIRDEVHINEEEYISIDRNYIIYIVFSRNIYNYGGNPTHYLVNVSANYIDLNVIGRTFDFEAAKSAIFDKGFANANDKWKVIYDKQIKKVENDAVKTAKAKSSHSKFSELDTNLTRHIFEVANNLTEYTNIQMSQKVNNIIQKAIMRRINQSQ